MLPPGIFLWESGFEGLVSPTSPQALGRAHPAWEADLRAHGPWSEPLDLPGLGRFLRATGPAETTVVVSGTCATTMDAARLLAQQGALAAWGSVLALEQRAGRGQLRRPWLSPPGNLHASLIMPAPPARGPWRGALAGLLPLVVGHVLSLALDDAEPGIRLKWPNDFLQGGRKVGGILIEERGGLNIAGLGLNLVACPSAQRLRRDHAAPAAVLARPGGAPGALSLWKRLVYRGKTVYETVLGEMEPSQFVSRVAAQLAWLGRSVVVRDGEAEPYYAEIVGISLNGGLVIRRDGRQHVLFSGSISPAEHWEKPPGRGVPTP